MASPTLQQLLQPVTADEVETTLLDALQGVGPIQQIGSGAGSITVAGAPLGNYDVILTITTAGSPGAAQFTYSLDGGTTTNGPNAVPSNGTYSLSGAGIIFQFSGVFDAGDNYLFQAVSPQFPVTSWLSGGVGVTWVKGEGQTIADFSGNAMAQIAGGGFVDYAQDQGTQTDWLSLISQQLYDNDRFGAQVLMGQVLLTLVAGAPTVSKSAGQLIVANGLGSGQGILTFVNSGPFTITAGTSLAIPVAATAPGALYNAANGVLTTLQTPTPGLSVNNPAPGTSSVTASGGATGGVTVTGTPNGNYNVVLLILGSGALGTATAQISLDGGNNFSSPFVLPGGGTYVINQLNSSTSTGLTLHLTSTFTGGDTYTFTSYASWILTPGQDIESGPALRARDKGRWGTLGVGAGNAQAYDFLARSAPNGGSEVVQTDAYPDPDVAGQVDVVVAGQTGPVSSGALANITAYITGRSPLTVSVAVINAAAQDITVSGTVYVKAAQQVQASVAIQTALSNYGASVKIAGLVEWTQIVAAIVNQAQSGVTNYTPAAPLTDIQLATATVVQFTISLTYVLT